MFLGTFQLKLDDKGRLSIPVRYREILQENYQVRSPSVDLEIILCYIGPHISAYPRIE
jgi:DNA-binding transcriptional regulator/RsmH inhibitor MraZ